MALLWARRAVLSLSELLSEEQHQRLAGFWVILVSCQVILLNDFFKQGEILLLMFHFNFFSLSSSKWKMFLWLSFTLYCWQDEQHSGIWLGARHLPTPMSIRGPFIFAPTPSQSASGLGDILKWAHFDLWMGFILSSLINALMPFSCHSSGKPFYSLACNFPRLCMGNRGRREEDICGYYVEIQW